MKATKIELEALQSYIKITPAQYREKTQFKAFLLGYILAGYQSLKNELSTLKFIYNGKK